MKSSTVRKTAESFADYTTFSKNYDHQLQSKRQYREAQVIPALRVNERMTIGKSDNIERSEYHFFAIASRNDKRRRKDYSEKVHCDELFRTTMYVHTHESSDRNDQLVAGCDSFVEISPRCMIYKQFIASE